MTLIGKELSMKEKAEAYDKALEKFHQFMDGYSRREISKEELENIFPGFLEPEDEKIRKDIISYIKAIANNKNISPDSKKECKTWISWLEKQGENKKEMNNFDVLPGLYKCTRRMYDRRTLDGKILFEEGNTYKCLSKHDKAEFEVSYGQSVYLEDPVVYRHFIPFIEQDDPKPTDTVEPEFEVGDWVVNKLGNIWHIDSFDGKNYQVTTIKGEHNHFPINIQGRMRPWTIQDAKPGDVLYHKAKNGIEYIVINKGLNEFNNIDSYFRYNSIDGFNTDIPSLLSAKCDSITPATKEQRDLLFQKMKEAGYEWDPEKKELRKIEQELTDEPKFKCKDWITNGRYAKLIDGINSDWPHYMFEDGTSERIKDIDKKYHLWTIQDAKPGDVLVDEDNNIGIYKEIKDTWWNSYIYLGCNNCLYGPGIGGMHGQNSTKPATKNQRDLLFSKMKEAGYEWDPGKKELKKPEQEPTDKIRPKFKVGDRIIKSSRESCPVSGSTDDTICEVAEVHDTCYILNTGEGRIQMPLEWQDHYELVKPAWSEEDENNINSIVSRLEVDISYWESRSKTRTNEDKKLIDWLKSLKDRYTWKPSKEQIIALRWVLNNVPYNKYKEEISGLLDQIKDL